MKISVVIPAYNRPDFLLEAVDSVIAQTYQDWEVVLVDDGSSVALPLEQLRASLGSRATFLRHEKSLGVARAKNAGIRAATGEVITILDDDDRLEVTALETIAKAYKAYPHLDCIFLGVEPFGAYAAGPAGNRKKALENLLERTQPVESNGLYFFDDSLFSELLKSVPIDFQRPAARRGTWNIVGDLIEDGAFSESSWAICASTLCRVALTSGTLSYWRIHDNNFGWSAEMDRTQATLRQIDNGLVVGQVLLDRFTQKEARLAAQVKSMRSRLAEDYFAKAYFLCEVDRPLGFRALLRSMYLSPRPKQLKLMLKYAEQSFRRRRAHDLRARHEV